MIEDTAWIIPMPWCFLRSLLVAAFVGFLIGVKTGVWVAWREGWK